MQYFTVQVTDENVRLYVRKPITTIIYVSNGLSDKKSCATIDFDSERQFKLPSEVHQKALRWRIMKVQIQLVFQTCFKNRPKFFKSGHPVVEICFVNKETTSAVVCNSAGNRVSTLLVPKVSCYLIFAFRSYDKNALLYDKTRHFRICPYIWNNLG